MNAFGKRIKNINILKLKMGFHYGPSAYYNIPQVKNTN
jgi:hypothetical protein